MRFLVHLGRMFRDLFGFAWQHKAWWLIPVVLLLLLLAVGIVAVQVSAPFIYTLF
jgi:hypothetical protein